MVLVLITYVLKIEKSKHNDCDLCRSGQVLKNGEAGQPVFQCLVMPVCVGVTNDPQALKI